MRPTNHLHHHHRTFIMLKGFLFYLYHHFYFLQPTDAFFFSSLSSSIRCNCLIRKFGQQPHNKHHFHHNYYHQNSLLTTMMGRRQQEQEDDSNNNNEFVSPTTNTSTNDDDDDDNFLSSPIYDGNLVVVDVLAIAIASQLMGLIDAITDPEFIRNGGWFQPIPSIPSTLNILIGRFSTLTLTWLAVATSDGDGGDDDDDSSTNTATIIQNAVRILIDFTVLRLLVGSLLTAVTTSGGVQDINYAAMLLLLLRDCYFVGLSVIGFRFLYFKLLK